MPSYCRKYSISCSKNKMRTISTGNYFAASATVTAFIRKQFVIDSSVDNIVCLLKIGRTDSTFKNLRNGQVVFVQLGVV